MARSFAHSSGQFVWTTLGTGPTTFPYGTIAAVIRASTDPTFFVWLSACDASDTWLVQSQFWSGNWDIGLDGSTTTVEGSSTSLVAADGWCFVAVSKDTGSVAPRFHKYSYTTGTWSHTTGGPLADGSGTVHHWKIGGRNTGTEWDGDIAIAGAAASVALSDNQIESLAYGLAPWYGMMTHVWPLWQDVTTQAVIDPINGGNENTGSSILPTIATSASPWSPSLPMMNFRPGSSAAFNIGQGFGTPGTTSHHNRTALWG